MIIDTHTHIFPEKIAARTLKQLGDIIHLTPAIDGTATDLLRSMEKSGINISLVLPVVTKPSQFDSILRFAAYLNETFADKKTGRIVSLAGIHPDDPDFKAHLQLIKQEGFSGIKLHPDYQGTTISDLKNKRILYTATELGMTVVTHAGFDPLSPQKVHCTPEMVLEVLDEVAPEKLVLAHLGSNCNYTQAEELLCGRNVYLDTAYSITEIASEDFVRMVRKHGADKVLFASDCPWAHQDHCVSLVKNSTLTDEEKDLIFSENAKKLFCL